jgi:uncharacterized protein YjbI with pentapeptide repeats
MLYCLTVSGYTSTLLLTQKIARKNMVLDQGTYINFAGVDFFKISHLITSDCFSFPCSNFENTIIDLKRGYLVNCAHSNFTNAIIINGTIEGASISNAVLKNMQLKDVIIERWMAKNHDLRNIELIEVTLNYPNCEQANFTNANLNLITINGGSLKGANFQNAKFLYVNMREDVDISDLKIKDTRFIPEWKFSSSTHLNKHLTTLHNHFLALPKHKLKFQLGIAAHIVNHIQQMKIDNNTKLEMLKTVEQHTLMRYQSIRFLERITETPAQQMISKAIKCYEILCQPDQVNTNSDSLPGISMAAKK